MNELFSHLNDKLGKTTVNQLVQLIDHQVKQQLLRLKKDWVGTDEIERIEARYRWFLLILGSFMIGTFMLLYANVKSGQQEVIQQMREHKRELMAQMREQRNDFSQQLQQLSERMDRRFEQVDQKFEQIDRRFEQVDRQFEQVHLRIDQLFFLLKQQKK